MSSKNGVVAAEDRRGEYHALLSELQEKVLLGLKANGFTDEKENKNSMISWVNEYNEKNATDSLESRVAVFTGEVKQLLTAYVQETRRRIDKYKAQVPHTEDSVAAAVFSANDGKDGAPGDGGDGADDAIDLDAIDIEGLFSNPQLHDIAGSAAVEQQHASAHATAAVPFSMLNWIESMGDKNTPTNFSERQLLQMLIKLEAMLADLAAKVLPDVPWIRSAAEHSGTTAAALLEYAVAAFVYSVDAKECCCHSMEECRRRQLEDAMGAKKGGKHRKNPAPPTNKKALGYNGAHWAQLNWALRVADDAALVATFDEETKTCLRDAIKFFEPLRNVLDAALVVFPKQPRVVFRGITVPVAHKYRLGTEVTFAPFSSTSLEGAEALKFMSSGGTYFVISTHSGALIEDFSHYPEQAEALLGTKTEFVVTSKMSRTLLQMLGNEFDVVFMSEKGSTLGAKARIRQLVEGIRTTEFVYAAYRKVYVEGRVSTTPPQLELESDVGGGAVESSAAEKGASRNTFPLYKATEHFVEAGSAPYMLLLGAGGAGKTSALVGSLCHLMQRKTRHTRPLMPIFISLPAVGPAIYEAGGLDANIRKQLRLDEHEAFEMLHSETRVVLLLDSLDEVPPPSDADPNNASLTTILSKRILSLNPWCARAKVIVSARTEFLELQTELSHEQVLHSSVNALVYHVWPFNQDDRQTFMRQAAADRIEELAKREAELEFANLREKFQLKEHRLSHPCLLRIATDVVRHKATDEYEAVRNRYSLYAIFVRKALEKFDADVQAKVLGVLSSVAWNMAKAHNWQLPIRELRDELARALAAGDDANGAAPHSAQVDAILMAIPARCEDLHHDGSMWGFWHKTVAEFLVAQRLWKQQQQQQEEGGAEPDEAFLKEHPTVREFLALAAKEATALHIEAFNEDHYEHIQADPPPANGGGGFMMMMMNPNNDPRKKRAKVWLETIIHRLQPKEVQRSIVSLDLSAASLEDANIFEETLGLKLVLQEFKSLRTLRLPIVKGIKVGVFVKTEGGYTEKDFSDESLIQQFDFRLVIPNTVEHLDMERSFPQLREIHPKFLSFGKALKTVKFPKTFKNVEKVSSEFMMGSGVTDIGNLMDLFSKNVKVIEDGFLADTTDLNTPIQMPKCARLNHIGHDFLRGSAVTSFVVPRDVFEVISTENGRDLDDGNEHNVVHTYGEDVKPPENVITQSSSFAEISFVGRNFLAHTPQLIEVSLPTFEVLAAVQDGFLRESAIKRLDINDCFAQVTSVGDHMLDTCRSLSEVVMPPFSSLESVGTHFLSNTNITALDISQSFSKLKKLSWGFLSKSALLKSIQFPKFEELTYVSESFVRQCPALESVDLAHSMPIVDVVAGSFLSGCTALKTITLPAFDRADTVPTTFLSEAALAELDMAHCFHNATVIETHFVDRCPNLEVIHLPKFEKVERLETDFLSKTKLRSLDLSNSFPNVRRISSSFGQDGGILAETAHLQHVEFPSFAAVKILPAFFLHGSGIPKLDLSKSFKNVTEIENGFLAKTKNLRELSLPSFDRVEELGDDFMMDSGGIQCCASIFVESFQKVEEEPDNFCGGGPEDVKVQRPKHWAEKDEDQDSD